MFKTEAKAHTWTTTIWGRERGKSGRSTPVTRGVYLIETISTGKFIVGTSRVVSNDVDRHLAMLANGKHPNKKLQAQWDWEPELRMLEFPTSSDKESKALEKEIRKTNDTPYCLLN
jgi:hypothetical protein